MAYDLSVLRDAAREQRARGVTLAELRKRFNGFDPSWVEDVEPPAKDAKGAGRTTKLSDDDVRLLRELRAADPKAWTYRALGDRFNVEDTTAWMIVKRRSRADVLDRPTGAAAAV